MNTQHPFETYILAIDLYSPGFAYAILEGRSHLLDWGLRIAPGNKIEITLRQIEKLIEVYKPDYLVLEDCPSRHSRRSKRIQEVMWAIVAFASSFELKVYLFSREQVRKTFCETGTTKHEIAVEIGKRFTQLSARVPPKRKPWKSELDRMNIFDAVALALTYFHATNLNNSQ